MDALILGGGIAGLAAAHDLAQKGLSFLLLEKASRFGGCLHSVHYKDFLLEKGPSSFLESQETFLQLIQELKLEKEVIQANASAKNRFILQRKKLKPFPKTPFEFLKTSLLSPLGKLRILAEPWKKTADSTKEESVSQFVTRRLGKEALRLVEPMIHGIYAGDPNQLSIQAIAPKFVEWEQKYKSLFKALKKARLLSQGNTLYSFKNGMQTVADTLYANLHSHCLAECQNIRITKMGKKWKVQWRQKGNLFEEESSNLLLCLPAFEASSLLETFDSNLSTSLREIPYAPIVVLHLIIDRSSITNPLNGFGFLAGNEGEHFLLGSLWSSSIFPHRSKQNSEALLTCFAGGAKNPAVFHDSEEKIVSKALQELKAIFGKKIKITDRVFTKINKALPQYTMGHLQRIKTIRQRLANTGNLFLAGNYLNGISVNDTMKNARETANAILSSLPPNWGKVRRPGENGSSQKE